MIEKERFADEIDRAAHIADQANEEAVAAARYRTKPEQVQNPDGSWPTEECVDCGVDLGPRLALGKVRCVTCQEILEKKARMYGK